MCLRSDPKDIGDQRGVALHFTLTHGVAPKPAGNGAQAAVRRLPVMLKSDNGVRGANRRTRCSDGDNHFARSVIGRAAFGAQRGGSNLLPHKQKL